MDSSADGSVFDDGASSPSPSSSSSELDYVVSQNGDIQSLYSDDDCQEVVKQILEHEQPIRIAIKLHVTENTYTNWETILNPVNNILYVAMPNLPAPGSKQTFMSLLEFAEEKLEVDAVVMCIPKSLPDRKIFLEAFMFMGFEALSRHSPLAPPSAEDDNNNFYLIYHIEE